MRHIENRTRLGRRRKSYANMLIVSFMLIFSAGCAKTPLQKANTYRQAGNYDEAIALYSQTITNSQSDREIFQHLFWRAQTFRDQGDFFNAYSDYYAAWIVSCRSAETERGGRRYTQGMAPSEYCRRWGKEKMQEIELQLDSGQIAAAKEKAAEILPVRIQ